MGLIQPITEHSALVHNFDQATIDVVVAGIFPVADFELPGLPKITATYPLDLLYPFGIEEIVWLDFAENDIANH